MRLKRWKPQKTVSDHREGDRDKRERSLLLLGASREQVDEGSRDDRACRKVLFALLKARSARVQTEPGWAERPCPCTLREARVCPVHESGRWVPLK